MKSKSGGKNAGSAHRGATLPELVQNAMILKNRLSTVWSVQTLWVPR